MSSQNIDPNIHPNRSSHISDREIPEETKRKTFADMRTQKSLPSEMRRNSTLTVEEIMKRDEKILDENKALYGWGKIGSRPHNLYPKKLDDNINNENDSHPDHQPITRMSYGLQKIFLINSNHTIYEWCSNSQSATKLAVNDESNSKLDIIDLATEKSRMYAISSDNELFCCDDSDIGQIGGGERRINLKKLHLDAAVAFVQLSTGNSHALALTDTGLVYAWGNGANGRLGLGGVEGCDVPQLVRELTDYRVVKVCSGRAHNLVMGIAMNATERGPLGSIRVSEDNSHLALSWGHGADGKLGTGSTKDELLPRILDVYGNVSQVACGFMHSAIIVDGDLMMFGSNEFGQLGTGNTNSYHFPTRVNYLSGNQIVDVSCGGFHTVAMTDDGEVFSWGLGNHGQLGNGKEVMKQLHPNRISWKGTFNIRYMLYNPKISCGPDCTFLIPNRKNDDNPEMINLNMGGLHTSGDSFVSSTSASTGNAFNASGRQAEVRAVLDGSNSQSNYTQQIEEMRRFIAFTIPIFGNGNNSSLDSSFAVSELDLSFRPRNLPAKSREEQLRHQKLVEENRKLYLKRMKERERQKELLRQEQEKRELRISQSIPIWEHEILAKWDEKHLQKRTRQLWMQGIPPVIRGKVWSLVVGNNTCITREYYNIYVEKARIARMKLLSFQDEADDENVKAIQRDLNILGKESSIQIIDQDLERTLPNLGLFKEGSPILENLREILEAFTFCRPDVGYVQGMSYLAGVLLLYMSPYKTFVCLVNLISRLDLIPFYRVDELQLRNRFTIFRNIFYENLPTLCEHFEEEGIEPKMYVFEWFLTLYSRNFNLNVASRIWDLYMLDGHAILYKTAVAILKLTGEDLITRDFGDIIQFFNNIGSLVDDEDLLVKTINEISLPQWVDIELARLASEYLAQE